MTGSIYCQLHVCVHTYMDVSACMYVYIRSTLHNMKTPNIMHRDHKHTYIWCIHTFLHMIWVWEDIISAGTYDPPSNECLIWLHLCLCSLVPLGRDAHPERGGGTWIGITKTGRFATLTNYRIDMKDFKMDAQGRGVYTGIYIRHTVQNHQGKHP